MPVTGAYLVFWSDKLLKLTCFQGRRNPDLRIYVKFGTSPEKGLGVDGDQGPAVPDIVSSILMRQNMPRTAAAIGGNNVPPTLIRYGLASCSVVCIVNKPAQDCDLASL